MAYNLPLNIYIFYTFLVHIKLFPDQFFGHEIRIDVPKKNMPQLYCVFTYTFSHLIKAVRRLKHVIYHIPYFLMSLQSSQRYFQCFIVSYLFYSYFHELVLCTFIFHLMSYQGLEYNCKNGGGTLVRPWTEVIFMMIFPFSLRGIWVNIAYETA